MMALMVSRSAVRIVCAATAFMLLAGLAFSQTGGDIKGATVVLQRFIDLNLRQQLQSPEAKALLVGEALERWDSPYWGKLSESPDKVMLNGGNAAVGRVQWFGANEQITDFYFYMSFDGSWKIHAMRALSLTGIVEQVYLELKKQPTLTEEQQYELKNAELTLASDAKLRAWFLDNQKSLDRTVRDLAKHKECGTGAYAEPKCSADAESQLRRLSLGPVQKHVNGDVFITIGGIVDNAVGFLFSPSKSPPQISPSEYIWVEHLIGNWYLYRTT